MNKHNGRGLQYQILLWFSLIILLVVLFYLAPLLVKSENILADDFSQFWAAGKLNIQGGNPYNPFEVTQTLQKIGVNKSKGETVSIMLNPPWTLALILPFSFLEYPTSRLIWLLFNIGLILLSTNYLLKIYGGDKNLRNTTYAIIFLFSPSLSALQKGQFTPIILLGIVLALYNINNRKDYWSAGISLALVSLKPQLVFLLWIVLILWTVNKGRWQLLISTFTTIMALSIIPFIINPNVMTQYVTSISEYPLSNWATPTLGSILRVLLGMDKFWLQFLPMLLGTIIYTVYWFRHKESWDWIDGSPMIVATSMLTTPYAWTYDAIIFIIPIVIVIIQSFTNTAVMRRIIILSSLLIISWVNLFLHIRLSDFWFFWLFPSLFVWYLISITYLKYTH